MTKNEQIAEFAAKLIEQGRNPILAVFDAMTALDPQPERKGNVVHIVNHKPSPHD